jgi:CBS domain-containing protein
MWLGPGRATEIAVRVGRGFAVVFVVLGLLYNPILVLVGLFIFIAGDAELQAGRLHRIFDGLLVSECMGSNVQTLSPDLPVSGAIERLLASPQASFPVIDQNGRPVGLLKRADLPVILKNVEGAATVAAVMGPPRIVQATTRLEDALREMNNMRDAAEIVVDGQGRMVGLLTLQNIAELFLVRSMRPAWKLKMRGS